MDENETAGDQAEAGEKRTMSDEQRALLSELAKQRTGEKNPFFGRHHSEETKAVLRAKRTGMKFGPRSDESRAKMSALMTGRTFSEETKAKMSAAAKARWTPEKRAACAQRMKDEIASGKRARPQGANFKDKATHPWTGKHLSEEHKEKLRQKAIQRGGHAHTSAERDRISQGNMRSIVDRKRTYRFHVDGPDGTSIPCRSEHELGIAKHLCETTGVVSVVGEDRMPFVEYTLDGQSRVTVSDFLVTRADGLRVIVEAKDATAFYNKRTKARIVATWRWCQANGVLYMIAMSNKGMPNVWIGPFVTELFIQGVEAGRVRFKDMKSGISLVAADPSACPSVVFRLVSSPAP